MKVEYSPEEHCLKYKKTLQGLHYHILRLTTVYSLFPFSNIFHIFQTHLAFGIRDLLADL